MPAYEELIETFPAHARKPWPRYGRRIVKGLLYCGLGLLAALVIKSVFFYRPYSTQGTVLLASISSLIVHDAGMPEEFGIFVSEVEQNLLREGFERIDEQSALNTYSKKDSAELVQYVHLRCFREVNEIRWYRKYVDDDTPLLVAIATHTDSLRQRTYTAHQYHCDVHLLWHFRGRHSRMEEFKQVGMDYREHARAMWELTHYGQLGISEEVKAADREARRKDYQQRKKNEPGF